MQSWLPLQLFPAICESRLKKILFFSKCVQRSFRNRQDLRPGPNQTMTRYSKFVTPLTWTLTRSYCVDIGNSLRRILIKFLLLNFEKKLRLRFTVYAPLSPRVGCRRHRSNKYYNPPRNFFLVTALVADNK